MNKWYGNLDLKIILLQFCGNPKGRVIEQTTWRRNEEKQRKKRTGSYKAPRRVKQKLPRRRRSWRRGTWKRRRGPSARGGRIGGGDAGGGATMLATMEPWSKGMRRLTRKPDCGSPAVQPGRPAPPILSTFLNNAS